MSSGIAGPGNSIVEQFPPLPPLTGGALVYWDPVLKRYIDVGLGTNLSVVGGQIVVAGASPGGTSGELQYNNSGVFGGAPISYSTIEGNPALAPSGNILSIAGTLNSAGILAGISFENRDNAGIAGNATWYGFNGDTNALFSNISGMNIFEIDISGNTFAPGNSVTQGLLWGQDVLDVGTTGSLGVSGQAVVTLNYTGVGMIAQDFSGNQLKIIDGTNFIAATGPSTDWAIFDDTFGNIIAQANTGTFAIESNGGNIAATLATNGNDDAACHVVCNQDGTYMEFGVRGSGSGNTFVNPTGTPNDTAEIGDGEGHFSTLMAGNTFFYDLQASTISTNLGTDVWKFGGVSRGVVVQGGTATFTHNGSTITVLTA